MNLFVKEANASLRREVLGGLDTYCLKECEGRMRPVSSDGTAQVQGALCISKVNPRASLIYKVQAGLIKN